jgi:nitrate reductase assembly molybdenum cofactor insertion protein NarJ
MSPDACAPGIGSDGPPLLRESAAWRLLALLFERPREGWHAEVDALEEVAADAALSAAVAAAREEACEEAFMGILVPAGVSPREVTWQKGDAGALLAELKATYEAFAFTPATEEAPDHVSVEAGFVGWLLLKEAYARAAELPEAAALTAEARATFVKEHMARLAAALAKRLPPWGVTYMTLAAEALAARAGEPPEEKSLDAAVPPCAEGCAFAGDEESAEPDFT